MNLFSRFQTTTTPSTPVLMPLSQSARISNFCSNLLSPFLLIICILSSQAILFQTFLQYISHDFLGRPFFMTIPPQTALINHILNLHKNTYPITKNINWHPINQSHPTHPDHTMLYATVSSHILQQYNKAGLTQH